MDGFEKMFVGRAVRDAIIGMFVVTTLWTLLVYFVPWSWLRVVFNLGFFFFTVSIGVLVWQTLKLSLTGWLAFAGALLCWFLFVLLVRSVELGILDAFFA